MLSYRKTHKKSQKSVKPIEPVESDQTMIGVNDTNGLWGDSNQSEQTHTSR